MPNCSAMKIVLWEAYFLQNDTFATPQDTMPEISCLLHERMEQMNIALAAVNLMYDPASRTVIKRSNSPSKTNETNRLSQKGSDGSESPAVMPKFHLATSNDLFSPLKLTEPKSPAIENSKYVKFRGSTENKMEYIANPSEPIPEKVLIKSPRFSLSPRLSLSTLSPSYPAPPPPHQNSDFKVVMESVPENSEVYSFSTSGPSTFSTSVRPSIRGSPTELLAIQNSRNAYGSPDSNAGSPSSSPILINSLSHSTSPSNQLMPPYVPPVPQYSPSSKKKFSISPPPVTFNKDAKSPLASNAIQFKFAINSPTTVSSTVNIFDDK